MNTTFKGLMNSLSQTSNILHEINPDEMQKLKTCLVEMYLDVYEVCKKYNIRIMLGGGSALGAVRHNGFIPWDDDLDIIMFRNDYEKLKVIFEEELGEKYILNAPNYQEKAKARFPKIMKKNTVMKSLTDIKTDLPCGVFLDIFPIEEVPENNVHQKIKGTWCNFLMFCSSRAYWFEHRCDEITEYMIQTRKGRLVYYLYTVVGWLCHMVPSWKWFDIVDKSVQYQGKTNLSGIPTGRKHYFGEILPKSTYLPIIYAEFENNQAPIPGDFDKYLRNLYGDYMQIPPPEKRERHMIVEVQC